jgi:hypothetical protein
MWIALRLCLGTGGLRKTMVVDFDTDTATSDVGVIWDWPVYGYRIDYWTPDFIHVLGVMTLYYEDHVFEAQHAPDSAWYSFWCLYDFGSVDPGPVPWTGYWDQCSGPHGLTCPPDYAFMPTGLDSNPPAGHVNPYLLCAYDSGVIQRVIDHKTIILDDAYADTAIVDQWPGDSWVRRPGYADSCWAAFEVWGASQCAMRWSPRLGCDGLWNLYAWKTNPPGDPGYVDSLAHFVWGYFGFINQAVAPFDTWELVSGPCSCAAGTMTLSLDDFSRDPDFSCWTYYDAFKLEWTPEGGDGGTSSSTVALGDGVQRVRVMPNPVQSNARISYTVPSRGRVHVVVYDVMGRAVLRASRDAQRAGLQNAPIYLDGLPAGAYIARVSAGAEHSTCRFVVCR